MANTGYDDGWGTHTPQQQQGPPPQQQGPPPRTYPWFNRGGGAGYYNRGGGQQPQYQGGRIPMNSYFNGGGYAPPQRSSVQNMGFMHPNRQRVGYYPQQQQQAMPPPQQRSINDDVERHGAQRRMEGLHPDVVIVEPPPAVPVPPLLNLPGVTLMGEQESTQPADAQTDAEKRKVRIRRRDFCITYYRDANNEDHIWEIVQRMTTVFKEEIAYCVFQNELTPSTGRPHWQMYIEMYKPHDISFVKDELFRDPRVHVEIRLKPRDDARDYCRKDYSRRQGPREEVGPFELGTWRQQGVNKTGERMRAVQESIAAGADISTCVEDDPDVVLRHQRSLTWYQNVLQQKDAVTNMRDVTVRLFIGDTGSGKSHTAIKEAITYLEAYRENPADLFILDFGDKEKCWFDGYNYGRVLILDDYHSQISVSFLLRLLDKYPLRLPVKGDHKFARYSEVWITTNIPLEQWREPGGELMNPEHLKALRRRIHWIIEFKAGEDYKIHKCPREPNDDKSIPTVFIPPIPSAVLAEPQLQEVKKEEEEKEEISPAQPPMTAAEQYRSTTPSEEADTEQSRERLELLDDGWLTNDIDKEQAWKDAQVGLMPAVVTPVPPIVEPPKKKPRVKVVAPK